MNNTEPMNAGLRRRGGIWWIRYYRDGWRYEGPSHSTRFDGAKQLLELREGASAQDLPVTPKVGRLRFDEAAADLVTEYKISGRRSLDELERRIRLHLKPPFGGRRVTAITTADVRTFVAARQAAEIVVGHGESQTARHPSAGEINRESATLKRIFSLGMQNGKLLHRPYIPMLREDNVRSGFFWRDQFLCVRSHLPALLQGVATFTFSTGWRIQSEVLPLQWRQVSFDERLSPGHTIAGTVRLDAGTATNGEARVFSFTTDLRDLLFDRKREADRLKKAGHIVPFVFFRMVAKGRGGEKHPKRITSFIKAWRTACIAASCPGRIPHDFRRTAVRNLVRAGIPERVAMKLTGHKTRSVFDRYNIVSDGDLASAAARLEEAPQDLEVSKGRTITGTIPFCGAYECGGDASPSLKIATSLATGTALVTLVHRETCPGHG